MEERHCKAQFRRPGGNASKGSEGYKVGIPTTWAKKIGLTKDDRDITISFDGKEIKIRKKNNDEGI